MDREIKLLKAVAKANSDKFYDLSMSAVIEYYSVLKCKAEESGGVCEY